MCYSYSFYLFDSWHDGKIRTAIQNAKSVSNKSYIALSTNEIPLQVLAVEMFWNPLKLSGILTYKSKKNLKKWTFLKPLYRNFDCGVTQKNKKYAFFTIEVLLDNKSF